MICLASVFPCHYAWTRSLREWLCVQSTWSLGMVLAMLDGSAFVLLEKLLFSYIAESLIKHRFGPFHLSRRAFKKFPCCDKHLNLDSVSAFYCLFPTICYSEKHPASPEELMLLVWVKRPVYISKYGRKFWKLFVWYPITQHLHDVLVSGKMTKISAKRANTDSTLELKKENKSEWDVCSH